MLTEDEALRAMLPIGPRAVLSLAYSLIGKRTGVYSDMQEFGGQLSVMVVVGICYLLQDEDPELLKRLFERFIQLRIFTNSARDEQGNITDPEKLLSELIDLGLVPRKENTK